MENKKNKAEAVNMSEKAVEAVSGKEKKEKKKNYIIAGVLAFSLEV